MTSLKPRHSLKQNPNNCQGRRRTDQPNGDCPTARSADCPIRHTSSPSLTRPPTIHTCPLRFHAPSHAHCRRVSQSTLPTFITTLTVAQLLSYDGAAHTMTSQAPPYTQPWRKIPIPRPLQVLFDTFPLRTYEANGLPERAERLTTSDLPTLYLFCTEEDARTGLPSYNPGCLKWQVRLDHLINFRRECRLTFGNRHSCDWQRSPSAPSPQQTMPLPPAHCHSYYPPEQARPL